MLQSMRSAAKWVWVFLFVAFVGGFLLAETSGLLGTSRITPDTPVATVNGEDIRYTDWLRTSQMLSQQRTEQTGQGMTADDQARI